MHKKPRIDITSDRGIFYTIYKIDFLCLNTATHNHLGKQKQEYEMSRSRSANFHVSCEYNGVTFYVLRGVQNPSRFLIWSETGYLCKATLSENEEMGRVCCRVQLITMSHGNTSPGKERLGIQTYLVKLLSIFENASPK